ncbi:MAG: polyprenol phosphomannose-dependent alpha 1,6 mannosyltransferase MptB [Acidimicrobiales bacterium]
MLAALRQRLTAEPDDRRVGAPSLRRYAVAGFAATAAVLVGAVLGGKTFISHLPGAWFFGMPAGPLGGMSTNSDHAPAVAVLLVYGGLAASAVIWWRLLRALRAHPGVPVRRVLRVIAAWSVPFVVAPPLFSRDAYSYAGQGLLVHFHIDPYAYGTGVLGVTRFNLLAGPFWANTPSPYGPTFLSLDGLAAQLSSHQVLIDLVLLRLLAVLGVALVAVGIPTLARSVGRDPALAVLLGAGSPLILATLVGGAHNDALMLGLLIAGLAVWQRIGPVPGIALCALAAGVKAPAALGVVAIGWNWGPPDMRWPTRAWRTIGALGIGGATLAVLSTVSGVGWGWLLTFSGSDKVSTGVTPIDAASHVVVAVSGIFGVHATVAGVRGVASIVGVCAAVLVGSWLLWHSPRLGVVKALGLSLLVISLLGPVLWAWYVTWGIVVLAPVATGGVRRAVVWIAVAESIIGASSVLGILRSLAHDGFVADAMVVVGVASAVVMAARASLDGTHASPQVHETARHVPASFSTAQSASGP